MPRYAYGGRAPFLHVFTPLTPTPALTCELCPNPATWDREECSEYADALFVYVCDAHHDVREKP